MVTPLAVAGVAQDVTVWQRATAARQLPSFTAMADLVRRHPTWPKIEVVRTNAEHALLDQDPNAAQLVKWFDDYPPRSDRGRFAYWQALRVLNYPSDSYLRDAWRTGGFNREQQQKIMAVARRVLTTDDHITRLDTLLWQGNLDRANDGLIYVAGGAKAWAKARMLLQRFSSTAPNAVAQVSGEWRNSNGLLLDLATYYRQQNNDDAAVRALNQRRKEADEYAPRWWRERAILVRRAMDRGEYSRAYQWAAGHGFTGGIELAEAEWLAGWLATTRLKNPSQGLKHFQHMHRNVKSSISSSRAAYWAGVALDQLGNKGDADKWYGLAARHMHTFYGQMAAYALGNESGYFDAYFKRSQAAPSSTGAPADLIEAARILNAKGHDEDRDAFLRSALTVLNNKKQPQILISVAKQLNSPEIALAAAKAAYENGVMVREALFPTMSLPPVAGVDRALTLAIIRQESMFDRTARSSANALGLMQLLPSTAAHTARQFGMSYGGQRDLFNVTTNTRLGQAYLSKLLNRYDGYLPLAIAAYNAGPGNVDKWLNTMGDPRKDARNWVDWVERIPFYETRNYVQRVWESYKLYNNLNR